MRQRAALVFWLVLLSVLSGCSRGYALYQSQGTPEAVALRGKPVATRIDHGANALTQNYERLVVAELQRKGSGFRYEPKKPELYMHVSTHRGMQTTGMNTGIRMLGSVSEFEQTDQVTVELSLKRPDGSIIWDGQILGDARFLTGTKAPKCLRVLFDLYGSNEAGEESCYQ